MKKKTGLVILGTGCVVGLGVYLYVRWRSKVIEEKINGTVKKMTDALREKNEKLSSLIEGIKEKERR